MRAFAAALAIVLLTAAPAAAQDTTPGEGLGGYDVRASALAISLQPVFPALLPTGDAPVEATVALSTGRVRSGGNALARGSILWPGNAAADPGPLFGQVFSPEIGALFPKWPLQAEASQRDGEVTAGAPPVVAMRAVGHPDRALGDVRAADAKLPGLLHVENIASTADTVVTDTSATSVARVTLSGVTLLNGYITAEQIRSISETTTTGASSTTSGDVDVVGLRIGGIEVSVTDDGFRVTGAPPEAGSAPGAGDEPFPGASPEEQVAAVLESVGARITLFNGAGGTQGGRADHYELGMVVSVDNPVGGQGPIPPGRFDLILGSTSSTSIGTSLFAGAGGVASSGGTAPSSSGGSGASSAPSSVSIGAGPEPGSASLTAVGESLDGSAAAQEGGGFLDAAPRRADYRFDGLPLGLVLALLLAAAVVARWIRNGLNGIIAARTPGAEEGSEP